MLSKKEFANVSNLRLNQNDKFDAELSTKKVLKPRGQVLTRDTVVQWKKHFI